MGSMQAGRSSGHRLRFVFDDRIVSVTVSPDATFGEIARNLWNLPSRRYGHPVAIDVTLMPNSRDGTPRSG